MEEHDQELKFATSLTQRGPTLQHPKDLLPTSLFQIPQTPVEVHVHDSRTQRCFDRTRKPTQCEACGCNVVADWCLDDRQQMGHNVKDQK